MSAIEYRGDIDGLRAVAVLSVVVFHAGLGIPGGFVGVDVFFVISGFLITSIVAGDLDQGRFTLANFWSRRIRRIWPAAAVMTLFALGAGSLVTLPDEYQRTGADAVSHVAMLANVRFWRRLDYFALDSDLLSLLHLWSLAVEEQFYVIFPPILAWLHRRGRLTTLVTLAGAAAASFAACIPMLGRDPSAVFYLVPFRAWELLVGSMLALLPIPAFSGRSAAVLGWSGLAMIGWSCVTYHRGTLFPGPAALVPVVGAALVIAAGSRRDSALRRLLEAEPLRRIGLVSYSLYLWHWPFLAFARYAFGFRLSPAFLAALLAAAAVATVLSYRFVETPFRTAPTPLARSRTLAAAIGLSVAVLVVGLGINRLRGLPGRFDTRLVGALGHDAVCRDWQFDAADVDSLSVDASLPAIGRVTGDDADGGEARPAFLLWGDSHGMAVSHVIDRLAREHGLAGLAMLVSGQVGLPGEPPSRGPRSRLYDESRYRRTMLEWIRKHRPSNVVLCSRWSANLEEEEGAAEMPGLWGAAVEPRVSPDAVASFDDGLGKLLEVCESIGARVWFLREVPFQGVTPGQIVTLARLGGTRGPIAGVTSRADHERRQAEVLARLARAGSPIVEAIDLAEPLLSGEGGTILGRDGQVWYADDDHLNRVGAEAAENSLIDTMMRSMAESAMAAASP